MALRAVADENHIQLLSFPLSHCLAARVWLSGTNLNIFPASPSHVLAGTDSDGLWHWGTLGKRVSWQDREVCGRPSLQTTGWPNACCTSSGWPQLPQHKQFSLEWGPKRVGDHHPEPEHLGVLSNEEILELWQGWNQVIAEYRTQLGVNWEI